MWDIFLALYLIGVMVAFGMILAAVWDSKKGKYSERLPYGILICSIFSWILVGIEFVEQGCNQKNFQDKVLK